eukprot:7211297-Prymnesium_polylepis.1
MPQNASQAHARVTRKLKVRWLVQRSQCRRSRLHGPLGERYLAQSSPSGRGMHTLCAPPLSACVSLTGCRRRARFPTRPHIPCVFVCLHHAGRGMKRRSHSHEEAANPPHRDADGGEEAEAEQARARAADGSAAPSAAVGGADQEPVHVLNMNDITCFECPVGDGSFETVFVVLWWPRPRSSSIDQTTE